MKFILDFDHTLFDSESFVATVSKAGRQADLMTPEIWDEFSVWDFIYPDANDFLRSHDRADLHILTAITPERGTHSDSYQRRKLESGNFGELVAGITFVVGEKGLQVATLAHSSEPTIFVDDRPSNIRSARAAAPQVHSLHMRRAAFAEWIPTMIEEGVVEVADFFDVVAYCEQL